jgi:hypothetical protein
MLCQNLGSGYMGDNYKILCCMLEKFDSQLWKLSPNLLLVFGN